MDITGHFESASCVIEVDGSATLAQVKGKLVAELGVPHARRVGVRMKGGGDIGDDDLRICDTEMDEGCAVELYCTGANITPGVIPHSDATFAVTLSPCDRFLAVLFEEEICIIDTETHERLCSFPCYTCTPSFSPCSEWIACVNESMEYAEVYDVKTGALKHSFGDEGDERWTTAWSPSGAQLLSWCGNGLEVWDIATGVLVHKWGNVVEGEEVMVVTGDRVAIFGTRTLTVWDYTTGVEVLALTCPSSIAYVALSPNERFIAACAFQCVRVWNIETGECVFEDVSMGEWNYVALSNDLVVASSLALLCMWSISTGEQLLHREFDENDCFGVAISSCGGVLMYGGDEGVEILDITE